ncbi:MAG: thiamine pyrophosphate-binding protein [bacterium]|nr:thiamine pyrophosphate-binding protein [bacterium]
MTGALSMAQVIRDQGLKRVFTFPGGTIAPLYDALSQLGIEIVCARHEQGAGYMALAASRLTGQPQVVMVTSGPGATNLATVIADAFYDSTPLVAICGQVGTGDLFSGRKVRQLGFQEIDCLGLMNGICKAAWQPAKPDDAAPRLEQAFQLAVDGRCGPVVIDLPMDVQRDSIKGSPEKIAPPAGMLDLPDLDQDLTQNAAEMIAQAQRPVILAGQGVLISGATKSLNDLAVKFRIPVVTTLPGIGSFDEDSDLSLGFAGHTGNQYAGLALHEADLLLVLGSRLDVRITGSETSSLAADGKIIHVDLDVDELEHCRVDTQLKIFADVDQFLSRVNNLLKPTSPNDLKSWHEKIETWKQEHSLSVAPGKEKILPQTLVEAINQLTKGQRIVATTGVGSHQHWAARHFSFHSPDRLFLTSAGHGAMGYDLPSAVGAAFACPDHTVICFAGDGSFQINIQELQTIVDFNLPVKIFVMDNSRLALVSQFQLMNWPEDLTCGNKTNPDFKAIGQAYGIKSWLLDQPDQLPVICQKALEHPGPALVHCRLDPNADIDPMLLGGQPLNQMWTSRPKGHQQ